MSMRELHYGDIEDIINNKMLVNTQLILQYRDILNNHVST